MSLADAFARILVPMAGIAGLLVGSFLNVVIWRLPRGESVVRPRSHCPRCDAVLLERDNIPVVSWLLLRRKCRNCGEPISGRYPTVELLTGILFGAASAHIGFHFAVLAYLYFTAIAVALAFIDYDTKRLPDKLTLPAYLIGPGLLAIDGAISHSWQPLLHAVIGMAALGAFYFVTWFVYPGGMGFGDVKLAGVVGLFLGWLGFGPLIVGAFLGFLLGGLWGIGLILVKKGTGKSAVPYGPFMLIGAMIAIFAGHPIAQLYVNHLR